MRVRPNGAELLSAARATLAERIVPQLGSPERACAARVERAMADAEGRLRRGEPASPEDLKTYESARRDVRDVLLKALPGAASYDARLVAKAISVAATELANGDAGEVHEIERLAELLGSPVPAVATADEICCGAAMLNARLVSKIRDGAFDDGAEAVVAHLEAITLSALSESNPTYYRLAGHEPASPRESSRSRSPLSARVGASINAWKSVSRAFARELTTPWTPLQMGRTVESWLRFAGSFGEAVSASSSAAMATQAEMYGYVAERVAANPDAPMFAVEGAHQFHDLTLAIADSSAAFFALVLAPFRGSKHDDGGAR